MTIYLVNQHKSYKDERAGGYLWSPKKDSSGRENTGYKLMTSVKPGDFIIHNSGGEISAISVVESDNYPAKNPDGIHNHQKQDDRSVVGYRVDTKYYDLDNPLKKINIKDWDKKEIEKNSCFDKNGNFKQRYLCNVTPGHAEYLLKEILSLQKSENVRKIIYQALEEIKISDDYDEVEKYIIDSIISSQQEKEKIYSGKNREPQKTIMHEGNTKLIPKRDKQRAANALIYAEYKCEYNKEDRTFLRKNGKPYTEPHHLIPVSKYADFDFSVDVEENIVSLCSHCHNLLHYGCMEDKEAVLMKLYNDRIEKLKEAGLELTFEQLKTYYL